MKKSQEYSHSDTCNIYDHYLAIVQSLEPELNNLHRNSNVQMSKLEQELTILNTEHELHKQTL